jgi:hypothetical protein
VCLTTWYVIQNRAFAFETRPAISASNGLLTIKQKLEKKIPGAPANEVPVHERKRQIYAQSITTQ